MSSTSIPNSCQWDQPKLTLGDLQGKSICHQDSPWIVLSMQIPVAILSRLAPEVVAKMYFSDPQTTWRACTNGLAKCAASAFALEETPLLPGLLYVNTRGVHL